MKKMLTTIDETTGKLNRVISEMKIWAKRAQAWELDEADIQTLKHHAEDMTLMAEYVLDKVDVGFVTPSPVQHKYVSGTGWPAKCRTCGLLILDLIHSIPDEDSR